MAEFYGLPIPQAEKATPVGDFIAGRLPAKPAVGDGIGIGMIGLVVHCVDERITAVGIELNLLAHAPRLAGTVGAGCA